MPDWVAQRIWLGTLSLLAALGARWLFARLGANRLGAITGALVYMLTPYQLAFTARISVILLAWVALPWLVGLTMRAVHDAQRGEGGWRDPALIALVIMTAGSVNASSMLFILLGPGVWIALELVTATRHDPPGRRHAGAYRRAHPRRLRVVDRRAARPGRVRHSRAAAHREPAGRVAVVDARRPAARDRQLVLLRHRLPRLLDRPGRRLRHQPRGRDLQLRRSRARARRGRGCSAGATAPISCCSSPSAWSSASARGPTTTRRCTDGSGSRSPTVRRSGSPSATRPAIAPLIVLGLAGLLAGAVTSLAGRRTELLAAAVVAVVAFGALLPVWHHGFLSHGVERAEDLPDYRVEATAALDRESHATRILEIPGSNFSAYRWGNPIDPITPGLTDRPVIAREVLPYGSAQTANLLDALDRRMQEGTFEAQSLAPVARLFSSGTVLRAIRPGVRALRHRPAPRSLGDSHATHGRPRARRTHRVRAVDPEPPEDPARRRDHAARRHQG